jgi:hypothetical protein
MSEQPNRRPASFWFLLCAAVLLALASISYGTSVDLPETALIVGAASAYVFSKVAF